LTATAAKQAGADPLPAALAAMRGCAVTRFVVDDSLTLVLQSAGCAVELRIDGQGLLTGASGELRFSPDMDPSGLAPVLGLMNASVAEVSLQTDGRLALDFRDGRRLAALPEDHHVAWSVRSTCGASASCIAEGRVVWQ
jgi:hypothetical protein